VTAEIDDAWAWLALADALLHRAALAARGGDAAVPAEAVELARRELKRVLDVDTPFSSIAANAALSSAEVEAFAVIAAIEMDGVRQQLVERLYGVPWLTPYTLGRVVDGDVDRSPVAPDGGPACCCRSRAPRGRPRRCGSRPSCRGGCSASSPATRTCPTMSS
jgi:hypothetical protein